MLGNAILRLCDQLRLLVQQRISPTVNVPHGHMRDAQALALKLVLDEVDRSLSRQHPYASSTDSENELAITISMLGRRG